LIAFAREVEALQDAIDIRLALNVKRPRYTDIRARSNAALRYGSRREKALIFLFAYVRDLLGGELTASTSRALQ
jgi:hypothetical protein